MEPNEEKEIPKIIRLQETLLTNISTIQADVTKIKRAIYGDKENLVDGMIHKQVDFRNRIKKLEMTKNRFFWTAAGFIIAFQLIVWFLSKAV